MEGPQSKEIKEVCANICDAMLGPDFNYCASIVSPLRVFHKDATPADRNKIAIDYLLSGGITSRKEEDNLIQLLVLSLLIKANTNKDNLREGITKIMPEIAEFLIGKNKAYGASVANPIRIFAGNLSVLDQINVRIDDKLSRKARGGDYPGDNDELDLVGYLILKRVICSAQEQSG
jgi:hypothetical protein